MNRLVIPILIIVFAIFTLQEAARAHAFLHHSEPRVGATVDKPPTLVRIWFTQQVEPAFSRIEVFDTAGKEVDRKDSHVDPSDHHILMVTLPALAAGSYKVAWRVVSVDTHHTQGDFKYVVKP